MKDFSECFDGLAQAVLGLMSEAECMDSHIDGRVAAARAMSAAWGEFLEHPKTAEILAGTGASIGKAAAALDKYEHACPDCGEDSRNADHEGME